MSSPKAAVKTARGKLKAVPAPARKAKAEGAQAASAQALQLVAQMEQGIESGHPIVSEEARSKLMAVLCKIYSQQIQARSAGACLRRAVRSQSDRRNDHGKRSFEGGRPASFRIGNVAELDRALTGGQQ